jgi:hypothetical protein
VASPDQQFARLWYILGNVAQQRGGDPQGERQVPAQPGDLAQHPVIGRHARAWPPHRVQRPGAGSGTPRWIGSCRRELLERTLVWNQRHQMTVLREYEDFCNIHRPHRALGQSSEQRLP